MTRAGYSRGKDSTDNRNICAIFILIDTSMAMFINSHIFFLLSNNAEFLMKNTFLSYAACFPSLEMRIITN